MKKLNKIENTSLDQHDLDIISRRKIYGEYDVYESSPGYEVLTGGTGERANFQRVGCRQVGNTHAINNNWGCYRDDGNKSSCVKTCSGKSSPAGNKDYSCCLTNYPQADYNGPNWYSGYFGKFSNSDSYPDYEPSINIAYAKFKLEIKYTWSSGTQSYGPSVESTFGFGISEFTSTGQIDWSNTDASFCENWNGSTIDTPPMTNTEYNQYFSNAAGFNRKDCIINGSTWQTKSPYDIPVVAVFGDWLEPTSLQNDGCIDSSCNNIKGIYPKFEDDSGPSNNMPPIDCTSSGCTSDDIDADRSLYPRIANGDIIYDFPIEVNSMESIPENLVFKMWDPMTDSIYQIGCWSSVRPGEYWHRGNVADPEDTNTIPIVSVVIDLDSNTSNQIIVYGCTDDTSSNVCNFDPCANQACNNCCTYQEIDDDNKLCGECVLSGDSSLLQYFEDSDEDGIPCDSPATYACPDNSSYITYLENLGYVQKGRCTHDFDQTDGIVTGTQCTPGSSGDEICDQLMSGSTCNSQNFDPACDCPGGVSDDCGVCNGNSLQGTQFWGEITQQYYSSLAWCSIDGQNSSGDTSLCHEHNCNWMTSPTLDCKCICNGDNVINWCGECVDKNSSDLTASRKWCYPDLDGDGAGGGDYLHHGKFCCDISTGYGYGSHYAFQCDGPTNDYCSNLHCQLDDNQNCPPGFSDSNADNPYQCDSGGNSGVYYSTYDKCNNDPLCDSCISNNRTDECFSDNFDEVCNDCIVAGGNSGQCMMGHDGLCYSNLWDIKLYDQCGFLRKAQCSNNGIQPPYNYNLTYPDSLYGEHVNSYNPCNRCGNTDLHPTNPDWNSTCRECGGNGDPCSTHSGASNSGNSGDSTIDAASIFGSGECKKYDASGWESESHCCTQTEQLSNSCNLCNGFDSVLRTTRRWPDGDGDGKSGYDGYYIGFPEEGYCPTASNPWTGANTPSLPASEYVECTSCVCGGSPDSAIPKDCSTEILYESGNFGDGSGCNNIVDGLQCKDDTFPECPTDSIDGCGICCNSSLSSGSPCGTSESGCNVGEPDPNNVCKIGGNFMTMAELLALDPSVRPCGCMNQGCGCAENVVDIPSTYYMDIDGDSYGQGSPFYLCNSDHECDCMVTNNSDMDDLSHCIQGGSQYAGSVNYNNYFCCAPKTQKHCETLNGDPVDSSNCNDADPKSYVPVMTEDSSCFSMTANTVNYDINMNPLSVTTFYYSNMDIYEDIDKIFVEVSIASNGMWNSSHPVVSEHGYSAGVKLKKDGLQVGSTLSINITQGTSPFSVNWKMSDIKTLLGINNMYGDYTINVQYPSNCTTDCFIDIGLSMVLDQATLGCTISGAECNYNPSATHPCHDISTNDCCVYKVKYYSDLDCDGSGCCASGQWGEYCDCGESSYCTDPPDPLPSIITHYGDTGPPTYDGDSGELPMYADYNSYFYFCGTQGLGLGTHTHYGESMTDAEIESYSSTPNESTDCYKWAPVEGEVAPDEPDLISNCASILDNIDCYQCPWQQVADCSDDGESTFCDCYYDVEDDCGMCIDPMCTKIDNLESLYGNLGGSGGNWVDHIKSQITTLSSTGNIQINPSNGLVYSKNMSDGNSVCESDEVVNNPLWNKTCLGCKDDSSASNYSYSNTVSCKGIGGNSNIGSYRKFYYNLDSCYGNCSDVDDVYCETDSDCVVGEVDMGSCDYDTTGTGNQGDDCCCIVSSGCVDPLAMNYNSSAAEDCGTNKSIDCLFDKTWESGKHTITGNVSIDTFIPLEDENGTTHQLSPNQYLLFDNGDPAIEVALITSVESNGVNVVRAMLGTQKQSLTISTSVYKEDSTCDYTCCEKYIVYGCTDPDAKNYYCYGEGNRINDVTKCGTDATLPHYDDGGHVEVRSCTSSAYGWGYDDGTDLFTSPWTDGTCGLHYLHRQKESISGKENWIKEVGAVVNFQAQAIGEFPYNTCTNTDLTDSFTNASNLLYNFFGYDGYYKDRLYENSYHSINKVNLRDNISEYVYNQSALIDKYGNDVFEVNNCYSMCEEECAHHSGELSFECEWSCNYQCDVDACIEDPTCETIRGRSNDSCPDWDYVSYINCVSVNWSVNDSCPIDSDARSQFFNWSHPSTLYGGSSNNPNIDGNGCSYNPDSCPYPYINQVSENYGTNTWFRSAVSCDNSSANCIQNTCVPWWVFQPTVRNQSVCPGAHCDCNNIDSIWPDSNSDCCYDHHPANFISPKNWIIDLIDSMPGMESYDGDDDSVYSMFNKFRSGHDTAYSQGYTTDDQYWGGAQSWGGADSETTGGLGSMGSSGDSPINVIPWPERFVTSCGFGNNFHERFGPSNWAADVVNIEGVDETVDSSPIDGITKALHIQIPTTYQDENLCTTSEELDVNCDFSFWFTSSSAGNEDEAKAYAELLWNTGVPSQSCTTPYEDNHWRFAVCCPGATDGGGQHCTSNPASTVLALMQNPTDASFVSKTGSEACGEVYDSWQSGENCGTGGFFIESNSFLTMQNSYYYAWVNVISGKVRIGFNGTNNTSDPNEIIQGPTSGWKYIDNSNLTSNAISTSDNKFTIYVDATDETDLEKAAEVYILEYGLYEEVDVSNTGGNCCCEYEYDCYGSKILQTDWNWQEASCTGVDGKCATYDDCGVCSGGGVGGSAYDYSTNIGSNDDNKGCGCFRGHPPEWRLDADWDGYPCDCQSTVQGASTLCTIYPGSQESCQSECEDYGYGNAWKYCLPVQFPLKERDKTYPYGTIPIFKTDPTCDSTSEDCSIEAIFNEAEWMETYSVMPKCNDDYVYYCGNMPYVNFDICESACSGESYSCEKIEIVDCKVNLSNHGGSSATPVGNGQCNSVTDTCIPMGYQGDVEGSDFCGCYYNHYDCLDRCFDPNSKPLGSDTIGLDSCNVCYGGSFSPGNHTPLYQSENITCNYDNSVWKNKYDLSGNISGAVWDGGEGDSQYDCNCSCPTSYMQYYCKRTNSSHPNDNESVERIVGYYDNGSCDPSSGNSWGLSCSIQPGDPDTVTYQCLEVENATGPAYIDECGNCVGGTTNMPPRWQQDSCGFCGGGSWKLPLQIGDITIGGNGDPMLPPANSGWHNFACITAEALFSAPSDAIWRFDDNDNLIKDPGNACCDSEQWDAITNECTGNKCPACIDLGRSIEYKQLIPYTSYYCCTDEECSGTNANGDCGSSPEYNYCNHKDVNSSYGCDCQCGTYAVMKEDDCGLVEDLLQGQAAQPGVCGGSNNCFGCNDPNASNYKGPDLIDKPEYCGKPEWETTCCEYSCDIVNHHDNTWRLGQDCAGYEQLREMYIPCKYQPLCNVSAGYDVESLPTECFQGCDHLGDCGDSSSPQKCCTGTCVDDIHYPHCFCMDQAPEYYTCDPNDPKCIGSEAYGGMWSELLPGQFLKLKGDTLGSKGYQGMWSCSDGTNNVFACETNVTENNIPIDYDPSRWDSDGTQGACGIALPDPNIYMTPYSGWFGSGWDEDGHQMHYCVDCNIRCPNGGSCNDNAWGYDTYDECIEYYNSQAGSNYRICQEPNICMPYSSLTWGDGYCCTPCGDTETGSCETSNMVPLQDNVSLDENGIPISHDRWFTCQDSSGESLNYSITQKKSVDKCVYIIKRGFPGHNVKKKLDTPDFWTFSWHADDCSKYNPMMPKVCADNPVHQQGQWLSSCDPFLQWLPLTKCTVNNTCGTMVRPDPELFTGKPDGYWYENPSEYGITEPYNAGALHDGYSAIVTWDCIPFVDDIDTTCTYDGQGLYWWGSGPTDQYFFDKGSYKGPCDGSDGSDGSCYTWMPPGYQVTDVFGDKVDIEDYQGKPWIVQNHWTNAGECMYVHMEKLGCMNSNYPNYDPQATIDDGSCGDIPCNPDRWTLDRTISTNPNGYPDQWWVQDYGGHFECENWYGSGQGTWTYCSRSDSRCHYMYAGEPGWINIDVWEGKGGLGDVCATDGNLHRSPGSKKGFNCEGYDSAMCNRFGDENLAGDMGCVWDSTENECTCGADESKPCGCNGSECHDFLTGIDICRFDENLGVQLECALDYNHSCDDQMREISHYGNVDSIHCCRPPVEDIVCESNYWLEYPYIEWTDRLSTETRGNNPICGYAFGNRWVCGDDGRCKDPCAYTRTLQHWVVDEGLLDVEVDGAWPCEQFTDICDCNGYGNCLPVAWAYDTVCHMEEEENLQCYGQFDSLCGECQDIILFPDEEDQEQACQESLFYCGYILTECEDEGVAGKYNCNYGGEDSISGVCPDGYTCYKGNVGDQNYGEHYYNTHHCNCIYPECDCEPDGEVVIEGWVPTCTEPVDGSPSTCCRADYIGDGRYCDSAQSMIMGCDLTCYSRENSDNSLCQIEGQGNIESGLPTCVDHKGPDGGDCDPCLFYDESGGCGCEGFVENCNYVSPDKWGSAEYPLITGSYQCCNANFIGDGFCDGEDQPYGCDLTCHSDFSGLQDGGDCDDCEGFTIPNCNYDPNISGSLECCPTWWIGDLYCDNELQCYGCDLTCYGRDENDIIIIIPEEDRNKLGDGGDCCTGDPILDDTFNTSERESCSPPSEEWISNCSDTWNQCPGVGEVGQMRWCPADWVENGICDDGWNGCDLTCKEGENLDCDVCTPDCNSNGCTPEECVTLGGIWDTWEWDSDLDGTNDFSITGCWGTVSSDCPGETPICKFGAQCIECDTMDDCGNSEACVEGVCEVCEANPDPCDSDTRCGSYTDMGCNGIQYDCPTCPDSQFCYDGDQYSPGFCYDCNGMFDESGGCPTDPTCIPSVLPNCSATPETVCCDSTMIGDDWCDGTSQPRGCDLTCYGITAGSELCEIRDASNNPDYPTEGCYGDQSCSWSGLPWCVDSGSVCYDDGGDCCVEGCDEGYVENCLGHEGPESCCPESWIGDGLCHVEATSADPPFGGGIYDSCDLSCYDDDGGDCDCASDQYWTNPSYSGDALCDSCSGCEVLLNFRNPNDFSNPFFFYYCPTVYLCWQLYTWMNYYSLPTFLKNCQDVNDNLTYYSTLPYGIDFTFGCDICQEMGDLGCDDINNCPQVCDPYLPLSSEWCDTQYPIWNLYGIGDSNYGSQCWDMTVMGATDGLEKKPQGIISVRSS